MPAEPDECTILAETGLAAPIRVPNIDNGLDSQNKGGAPLFGDRPHIFRHEPNNETNIVTDADRALLKPDPHRHTSVVPISGSPIDLLPISVLIRDIAGAVSGSRVDLETHIVRTRFRNPGRQCVRRRNANSDVTGTTD